jgi:hypothetical protein
MMSPNKLGKLPWISQMSGEIGARAVLVSATSHAPRLWANGLKSPPDNGG